MATTTPKHHLLQRYSNADRIFSSKPAPPLFLVPVLHGATTTIEGRKD